MATGIVNLRTFILGLLALKPMSGYDVKRFLRGLSWLIGSPSPGSLYPILRTLLEEGRVTVETVPSTDRPPRKIYTITEDGRGELETWLDQPAADKAPLKSFVMRLLLADHYAPPVLCRHLDRRRDQVAAKRAGLLDMTQALDGNQQPGRHMALEYGLALASAELTWLERTLERLAPSKGGEEP